jgi:hypothetical protein
MQSARMLGCVYTFTLIVSWHGSPSTINSAGGDSFVSRRSGWVLDNDAFDLSTYSTWLILTHEVLLGHSPIANCVRAGVRG